MLPGLVRCESCFCASLKFSHTLTLSFSLTLQASWYHSKVLLLRVHTARLECNVGTGVQIKIKAIKNWFIMTKMNNPCELSTR